MKLYHVSYRPIDHFELRIPAYRLFDEDAETPRICCSNTIENCINAKPERTDFLDLCIERNLPCVLFIYTFEVDPLDPNIVSSKELEQRGLVPDALQNQEFWMCNRIYPYEESIFKITKAVSLGKGVDKVTLKPIESIEDYCFVWLSEIYSRKAQTNIDPNMEFPDLICNMEMNNIDIKSELLKFMHNGSTPVFDDYFLKREPKKG